ncbi:hypothetical protein J6590_006284 [Homalodisca vitripennis]|nr:hypothetical protein J6590_006284 [Homalodisca vitripennis]
MDQNYFPFPHPTITLPKTAKGRLRDDPDKESAQMMNLLERLITLSAAARGGGESEAVTHVSVTVRRSVCWYGHTVGNPE